MKQRMLALVLGALVAGSVHAAGDAGVGKGLFVPCAACHGANAEGNTALSAPVLAGQDAAYIERQLQNFRAGRRGASAADTLGAQMRGMAATLADDAAVANIAAFVSGLPAASSRGELPGDLMNGNNFYQGKCGACHGGKAEGNASLNAPRLAGQDPGYLKRQFLAFQKGTRGAHPEDRFGRQMAMMATTLGAEKDIDDVLAFIHAQAPAAR